LHSKDDRQQVSDRAVLRIKHQGQGYDEAMNPAKSAEQKRLGN